MISVWILWLVAAGLLLVIELFTGTVAAFCMAVGCLVAAPFAAVHLPLVWQIVICVVSIILAFVYLRPLVKRLGNDRNSREYRTNMDALIGRTGKVTHEITNNFDDKGRVQIDGDNWLAYTTEPDWPIRCGEQVIVDAYDSLVLRVRRYKTIKNQ